MKHETNHIAKTQIAVFDHGMWNMELVLMIAEDGTGSFHNLGASMIEDHGASTIAQNMVCAIWCKNAIPSFWLQNVECGTGGADSMIVELLRLWSHKANMKKERECKHCKRVEWSW